MLEKVPEPIGHALQGVRAGMDKLVWEDDGAAAPASLVVTSTAFVDGGDLPTSCTEDGAGASPPLAWSGTPAGAASMLLIVEDADSPTPRPILHALAYDLPGGDGSLAEGALNAGRPGALGGLGKNSFGKDGWLPPDPPTGHGVHRYVFQLYALGRRLELATGAGKSEVVKALAGGVVARGRVIGTYER